MERDEEFDLREAGIPPDVPWHYEPHEPRLATGTYGGPMSGLGRGGLTLAQQLYLAAIVRRHDDKFLRVGVL